MLCTTLCARSAPATTVDACLARKLGDVGKSVTARVRCEAQDAGHPDAAAHATCRDKMRQRFAGVDGSGNGQFERLERALPCLTTGDQALLDAAIASYVTALDEEVGNGGTASKCDAAKLTCVARYVAGVLTCQAHAAARSGIVDAACLLKRTMRLTDGARGCLDKAEAAARQCSESGDAAALEDGADAFVADTLCTLDPAGTAGCTAPTAGPKNPTPTAKVPTATPQPASPTPLRTATPSATRTLTPSPARTVTPTPTPEPNDPAQLCVDEINRHRASIGLGPLTRWTAEETCVDGQSQHDSQTGTAHSAFGQCGEWAQNECPGWPGPPAAMIPQCLQAMWNEGPGQDFATHGHYINMTNPNYSKVACGFFVTGSGAVWAAQDFQ